MKQEYVVWEEDWIPDKCIIRSSWRLREDLYAAACKTGGDAVRKMERKLHYIGTLKVPISNKEYMYFIEKGYYECYIFGQKSKYRLAYEFKVDNDVTLLTLYRLTDHKGIKNRAGLNEEYKPGEFTPDDDTTLYDIGYDDSIDKENEDDWGIVNIW